MEDHENKHRLGAPTEPANIVIFSAADDLTKRKLLTTLIKMFDCSFLHPESRIIGIVKDPNREQWLEELRQGIFDHSPEQGYERGS